MEVINEINVCSECNSEYYAISSEMSSLCPECSHKLYGYKNCEHSFLHNRCIKCYWDGSLSDYLKNNLK